MLSRHAVQELVRAKVTAREIAKQVGVSIRTVRRIIREGAVESADDGAARRERGIGRPGVEAAVRDRVRALLGEDPERPPGEICRLLRAEGTPLGLSTVYRLLHEVRPTIPTHWSIRPTGSSAARSSSAPMKWRTSSHDRATQRHQGPDHRRRRHDRPQADGPSSRRRSRRQ